jgi:hypothetical protein
MSRVQFLSVSQDSVIGDDRSSVYNGDTRNRYDSVLSSSYYTPSYSGASPNKRNGTSNENTKKPVSFQANGLLPKVRFWFIWVTIIKGLQRLSKFLNRVKNPYLNYKISLCLLFIGDCVSRIRRSKIEVL